MSCRIVVVLKGDTQIQPIIGNRSREQYREAFTQAIKEKSSTISIVDQDGDYHIVVVDEIKAFVVALIDN